MPDILKPQARHDDIVVQKLFDELVIYDLKRDKIHALNLTAAFVWQHCDGSRSRHELAGLLAQKFQTPQADALLALTLDRLKKAHLLTEEMAPNNSQRPITRREVLKLAGVTVALLPVVKSITAPTMAQAQSTTGCGGWNDLCGAGYPPCCPEYNCVLVGSKKHRCR
jgi:hypothetical protein